MGSSNLSVGIAFIAGLASFLSPCVFSLVPAYLGYLGGRSAASAQGQQPNRWLTFSHGIAFVLGFTLVFLTLGLGASALGNLVHSPWLTRFGGLVVLILGIHMTGIIRIPFLEYDLRPQTAPDRKWGYLSSALMGVFFSAGWSPCVGPILGTILTISFAGGSVSQGLLLLAAYSAGLAIPFLIAAAEIGLVTQAVRRYGKAMRYVEIAMGVLMIAIGALLLYYGGFGPLATIGADLFVELDEVTTGRTMLIVLAAAAGLGLVPAWLARQKGRHFVDWWLFGATLFPLALVMALRLRPPEAEKNSP